MFTVRWHCILSLIFISGRSYIVIWGSFPKFISLITAFITVFSSGGVKEKGASKLDLEVASVYVDKEFSRLTDNELIT